MSEARIRPDRVAAYIRWSTDDQASGTTPELQLEGCRHYIRSQGWTFRDDLVFVDDGYSGGNLDRPAMAELRRRVAAGEVDCVVVLKIDRLSRNIVDAVDLVLREWDGRCHVKSVREPIDTTTDLGRVIFGILAMFADFERATIRERTLGGKERRIAEGRQMHGRPAFGYRAHPTEKGRWVEEPREAPVVRYLFRLAREGLSPHQIARRLNAEGIPTRSGRPWSARSVLHILQNRTYVGEVVYGRTSVVARPGRARTGGSTLVATKGGGRTARIVRPEPKIRVKTGAVVPLVDAEVFEAVQAALAARRRRRATAGSRALGSRHLLVGMARCACGAALVHRARVARRRRVPDRVYRSYACARSGQGGCSGNGHVPAEVVERALEEAFLAAFGLAEDGDDLGDGFRRAAAAVAGDERAALAAAVRAAEQDLARLADEDRHLLRAARAGQLAPQDLRDLRRSLEAERAQVASRLAALQPRLARLEEGARALAERLATLTPRQRWDRLTAAEKRHLMEMGLWERLTIVKPKGRRHIDIVLPLAF
ncbi:MAG: recombinase family protein [Clostridia bacterium]|nr:recombinase family protein [Clostridia bacterium]